MQVSDDASSYSEIVALPIARPQEGILKALSRRAVYGSAALPHRGLESWSCARLCVQHSLSGHQGCVNAVDWRADGRLLVSGSDDAHICLWDRTKGLELAGRIQTGHRANIFCVRFLSNDVLTSCSLDGSVRLVDAQAAKLIRVWDVHRGAAEKVLTYHGDEHTIVSCGDDGTVCQLDRRERSSTVLMRWRDRWEGTRESVASHGINSIASCQLRPHQLLIGGEDPLVWLYDRRRLSDTPPLTFKASRKSIAATPVSVFHALAAPIVPSVVTGVAISGDGERLLASWSSHHVFQFRANSGHPQPVELLKQLKCNRSSAAVHVTDAGTLSTLRGVVGEEFVGHSNRRTIKEVAYVGAGSELVASGSDDGRLFVWDAFTTDIVCIGTEGDRYVVNALAPHPREPLVATGGIDPLVKVWAPIAATGGHLSRAEIAKLVKRNEHDRRIDPTSLFRRLRTELIQRVEHSPRDREAVHQMLTVGGTLLSPRDHNNLASELENRTSEGSSTDESPAPSSNTPLDFEIEDPGILLMRSIRREARQGVSALQLAERLVEAHRLLLADDSDDTDNEDEHDEDDDEGDDSTNDGSDIDGGNNNQADSIADNQNVLNHLASERGSLLVSPQIGGGQSSAEGRQDGDERDDANVSDIRLSPDDVLFLFR